MVLILVSVFLLLSFILYLPHQRLEAGLKFSSVFLSVRMKTWVKVLHLQCILFLFVDSLKLYNIHYILQIYWRLDIFLINFLKIGQEFLKLSVDGCLSDLRRERKYRSGIAKALAEIVTKNRNKVSLWV